MSAADRVLALVSGFPEAKRKARSLMILQACADDSGSEPSGHTFVFGGFVADPATWAKFSDDWQAVLDLPPKLEYFKMTDAMSMCEQFAPRRGWTEALRDMRIHAFIDVIEKHLKLAAYSVMRHEDFEKIIKPIPLPQRHLATDHPYFFLATQFILAVATRQRKQRTDNTIKFVFDQQLGFSDDFIVWWPALKHVAETQGLLAFLDAAPIWEDEKKFLPLQAADLFVWEYRNFFFSNKLLVVPTTKFFRRLQHIETISHSFTLRTMGAIRDALMRILARELRDRPSLPLYPAGKKHRKLGFGSG